MASSQTAVWPLLPFPTQGCFSEATDQSTKAGVLVTLALGATNYSATLGLAHSYNRVVALTPLTLLH